MASGTETEGTLPVFVINNQLPAFDKKMFTTAELCAAAEKICGYGTIDGAQRIGSLWRIYPRHRDARQQLLVQGFVLRGVQVSVKAQNPFLVRLPNGNGAVTEEQPPSTKLIIGNVPLSFSDNELLQAIKQLRVTVMSKLIPERDRDENGKLTHWKTGRRFLYVAVPNEPLPKTVEIGPFKATLYHKEQKTVIRQQQSECRRCLAKGHRTSECLNPIKCKQCFGDGHKAGDPVCTLVAQNTQEDNVSQNQKHTNTETNTMPEKHKTTKHTNKTTTRKEKDDAGSKSESRGKDIEVEVAERGRPRSRKHQTTLSSFRREGSGSVKRPRSIGSSPNLSDKQPKLTDRSEESADEEDNNSMYHEPVDFW